MNAVRRIPILAALAAALLCAALLPADASARVVVRGRIFRFVPVPVDPRHPLPIPVPYPQLPGNPGVKPAQPKQPRHIVNPALDNQPAGPSAPGAAAPAARQIAYKPLKEGVADLPNDAHLCHLTVFLNYNATPRDNALASWIQSDKELAAIAAQCHVQYIYKGDPNDPTFESIYAASVTQLPCFRMVSSDTSWAYQLSGNNLKSAGDLREKVKAALRKIKDKIKHPLKNAKPKKVAAVDGPHEKRPASVAMPASHNGVPAGVLASLASAKPAAIYNDPRRPCPCPTPGPAPGPVAPPYIVNPAFPDTVDVDVVDEEDDSDDKGLYAVLGVGGCLAFALAVGFSMYRKINE